MSMTTSTKRRRLAPGQKRAIDCILRLRLSQQERVFELVDLFRKSESAAERVEIAAVLAEVLFGGPEAVVATPIYAEQVSEKARQALSTHRDYVAKQIRKRRHQLKMTQEELAEKAGLPQSHICRLERGQHAPTHLTVEKLARALDVRMSDIDPSFDD